MVDPQVVVGLLPEVVEAEEDEGQEEVYKCDWNNAGVKFHSAVYVVYVD